MYFDRKLIYDKEVITFGWIDTLHPQLYDPWDNLSKHHSGQDLRHLFKYYITMYLYTHVRTSEPNILCTITTFHAIITFKKKLFHAVSRTQQSRQKEPSVKAHRSPLSIEFWRHCVLSGGTQHRTLPRHQSEEMKM